MIAVVFGGKSPWFGGSEEGDNFLYLLCMEKAVVTFLNGHLHGRNSLG